MMTKEDASASKTEVEQTEQATSDTSRHRRHSHVRDLVIPELCHSFCFSQTHGANRRV